MDGIQNASMRNVSFDNFENISPLASFACGNYTGPHDGGTPGTKEREGFMSPDTRGISIIDTDLEVAGDNFIANIISWYGDAVGIDVMIHAILDFDFDTTMAISALSAATKVTQEFYEYLIEIGKSPFPNNFKVCNISRDNKSVIINGDVVGLEKDDCILPQFMAASSDDNATIDTLHKIHGVCMWISMGLLCSIAIIAAKYKKYVIHKSIQRVVVVLMIAGFVIAVIFTSMDDDSAHFDGLHGVGGLIVVSLMVIQGIGGMLRPEKKEDNKSMRECWETGHKYMGRVLWLMGQIVIFLGLRYFDETLSFVQIVWAVMMAVVYVIVKFKVYKDDKMEKKGYVDINESFDESVNMSRISKTNSKLFSNKDKQMYS